jgi:TPR repeat protein
MAKHLIEGKGVKKDPAKAIQYLKDAAKLNSAQAKTYCFSNLQKTKKTRFKVCFLRICWFCYCTTSGKTSRECFWVFHSWNYKRRNNSNLWINFDTNKKAIYHI